MNNTKDESLSDSSITNQVYTDVDKHKFAIVSSVSNIYLHDFNLYAKLSYNLILFIVHRLSSCILTLDPVTHRMTYHCRIELIFHILWKTSFYKR